VASKYKTYQEYLATPEFRDVCKIVAGRSGGVCERCEFKKADQFHHVKYPRWGSFDVAANLLHVCYPCHCELHRCERCGETALKAAEIKSGDTECRECRDGRRSLMGR
jgi:hypothetical protein